MLTQVFQSVPYPLASGQTNHYLMGMFTFTSANPADQTASADASVATPAVALDTLYLVVYLIDSNDHPTFEHIRAFSYNPVNGTLQNVLDFSPGIFFASSVVRSGTGNTYFNHGSSLELFDPSTLIGSGMTAYNVSKFAGTNGFFSMQVQLNERADVLLNNVDEDLFVYQLSTGNLQYTLHMPEFMVALCLVDETRAYVLCQNNILVLVDFNLGSVLNIFYLPPTVVPSWRGDNLVSIYWYPTYSQLFVCEMIQSPAAGQNSTTVVGYRMLTNPVRLTTPIPLASPREGDMVPVLTQLVDDLNKGVGGSPVTAMVTGSGQQVGFAVTDSQGKAMLKVACTSEGMVAINCTVSIPTVT